MEEKNKWIEDLLNIAKNIDNLDEQYFSYTIEDGQLVSIGLRHEKQLTIPSDVKRIGSKVFSMLTDTELIIMPDQLEVINEYAFYGCSESLFP